MAAPTLSSLGLPPGSQMAMLIAWNDSLNSGAGGWEVVKSSSGSLASSATIAAGDIQIGAVELKNGTTDDRAVIDASGAVSTNLTKVGSSSLALGATTKSASLPVAIATDQMTATAATDAGRLPVSPPDSLVVSGSVSSAATIFTQDATGYNSISVQITNPGTSCNVVYEASNDQTTWYGVPGLSAASASYSNLITSSSTAIILNFGRVARYFRVRVSTYGSGTVSVVAVFSTASFQAVVTTNSASQWVETSSSSGAPLGVIGLQARTSSKTSASNGSLSQAITTVDGRQIVRPHSIPENQISYAAAVGGITNTTTAVTMFAAAGASVRNYLASVHVSSEALGTATELVIRDGAGGTVLWRAKIPTTGWTNGGINIEFPTPLRGSTNTLMEVATLTASGTGAVYVNAQGYVGP